MEGISQIGDKGLAEAQTVELSYKTSLSQRLVYIEEPRAGPVEYQQDSRLIQLPKISDHRGSLSFIEGDSHIPFKMQSVYWIYDISNIANQADNSYRGQHEFIVAMSGSVEVTIDNGREQRSYRLDRPDQGLHVPNLVRRRLARGSANAVILVLASQAFQDKGFQPEPLSYVEAKQ